MDGFHDIGPIAEAERESFTAVGDDDGLRLRVGFVEGEEEAEALLGFDGVRAGGGSVVRLPRRKGDVSRPACEAVVVPVR